jgi:adenylylsulfate kinase-like enzyme
MCNEIGLITVVALVSPYETDRCHAREIVGDDRFFEVHINAPVETCEERDTDGLYTAAKSGEIERFTGVSAPYEHPVNPALRIDSKTTPVEESVQMIVDLLKDKGVLA